MNKELRKKIETELSTLINNPLSAHQKEAAAEISKYIRDTVKSIAKKFVKHLPVKSEPKKPSVKKTKAKKTSVKKSTVARKTKVKAKPGKAKVKSKR